MVDGTKLGKRGIKMRYQLMAVVSAAALLTACESSMDKNAVTGAGDNWPNPSASVDGPIPGSAADFHKNVSDTVHFDLDKYALSDEAKGAVSAQAEWLKKWPSVNVVVEGHCDQRGTTEYNMALGERRAQSVKDALVSAGVEAVRIEVVSYGKEHPLDAATTEAAYAANRRGVTVVR